MRKWKGFVGVFLLLVQYFWLFTFAYEIPPEDEIVQETMTEDSDILTQEDGISEEELFVSEEDLLMSGEEEPDGELVKGDDNQDSVDSSVSDFATIDDEQEEVFTTEGDITQEELSPSLPLLIITEVYFAGINERFELYNPHDEDFSGTLEVAGARSSLLILENIYIPAKKARVISRSQGLDLMVDTSVVDSIHTLSMPNTNPIYITLSLDGEVIDIFSASVSLMNQANKSTSDRASLQRTLDDISIVHVSPASQNYNSSDPIKYKINPGVVYYSLADGPPQECEEYGQTIQIREVFWGSDEHAPYIELFAPQGFSQNITIGGSQLMEDFDISVDQPAGHYHIVTIPENSYTKQPFVSDNQKLSLSSELGNIAIYGQNGQVLDKVDIQVKEEGYSSYVRGLGCDRVADIVDNFSPGFIRDYLSYFPDGAEKIITITETITIPGETQTCTQEEDLPNPTPNSPSTPTPGVQRDGATIQITNIQYSGPTTGKSITLYQTGNLPIDMSSFFLLTNNTNKRNLRGVLEPNTPLTLTGSLGFAATQPRCVELFHSNNPQQAIDAYCYDPVEDAKRQGEIKITNIIYQTDPGSTIRKLHLHVPEGMVNLANNRYIMINTTKRNLTSYGSISGHVVLEGTFPFPKTSNTCVELRQYDKLFDTYCYTIPQSINNQNPTPFDSQRLSYPIAITHIHYTGPTTGKSITLSMQGGSPVDLSHFHILINKTTKRNLRGTLQPNTPLILTGSLGFAATQPRCVELFHKEHLFDTYCYDPQADKEKEQQARVRTGDIDIVDVRYLTDENNPDQQLILLATGSDIIFAHGRYLMINTRRFSLQSFGTGGGEITFTGNFRFPKTVASCVTIGQYDQELASYCYDPKSQKQTEKKETITYTGVQLEILATLPNPRGADTGKERIDIMLHSPDTVDLSQGFSILINGRTKRAISGQPIAGEVYRLTGKFTLPNTASCFSILYHEQVLDAFCYPQTKEGIIYNKNSTTLLDLTDVELGLLNATKLTRFDNRLCLTLSDVTIKCRTIPAGKLAARQMEELKLSRNYINLLHDYLYNHWQLIYFNSDIVTYKTLFDTSKKDISSSKFTRSYGSEKLPIADIQTRFQLQYQQPLLKQIQGQVSSKLFGPKLTHNYKKAKERYYTSR